MEITICAAKLCILARHLMMMQYLSKWESCCLLNGCWVLPFTGLHSLIDITKHSSQIYVHHPSQHHSQHQRPRTGQTLAKFLKTAPLISRNWLDTRSTSNALLWALTQTLMTTPRAKNTIEWQMTYTAARMKCVTGRTWAEWPTADENMERRMSWPKDESSLSHTSIMFHNT